MDFTVLGSLLLSENGEVSDQKLDVIFGWVDEIDSVPIQFLSLYFQPFNVHNFHGHEFGGGENVGQQECGFLVQDDDQLS